MKINPVLLKEMKVKMRGWRAAGIIIIYLAVLTLVTVLVMYEAQNNLYATTVDQSRSIATYWGLALIQFILIMFIAPALTSGAISGEREKQTLDLMLCTKLSPIAVIMGKLIASISHVILLIAASLPIFSVVFLYGGISIFNVFQLFVFYIITAFAAGAIGIFYSAYMKKTTASTVMTYGTGAFMILGTVLITYFYIGVIRNGQYDNVFPLLYTNPLVGFSSLLMEQFGYFGSGILRIIPGVSSATKGIFKDISPWIVNIVFDMLLSGVLIVLAARKISPVKKRVLLKRRKR